MTSRTFGSTAHNGNADFENEQLKTVVSVLTKVERQKKSRIQFIPEFKHTERRRRIAFKEVLKRSPLRYSVCYCFKERVMSYQTRYY